MSHLIPAPSTGRSSKVSRLTAAVRKTWTDARTTDRELMELRTHLSRHSG